MIQIVLGNIGSGKTSTVVREIVTQSRAGRHIFSNIALKGVKNSHRITVDMLVKTEIIGEKRDGTPIKKLVFNKEFWEELPIKYGAIDVVIDEAHTILNPRRSMSKVNVIMSDFMAMLRRVLGSTEAQNGTLTLITQLDRRIDVIAREMSTQFRYCLMHYVAHCEKNHAWRETSDTPIKAKQCPACASSRISRCQHKVEIWEFASGVDYIRWREFGQRRYYRHSMITDISDYFGNYNTLQWDDLFDSLYS